MRKTKPFDDGELDISKTLGVDDFNLSLKEIDFVRCTYNTYVHLQDGGFNHKKLVRDFPYMGGVRFNYLEYSLEDENYINLVFKETISKYGYVIPFTFENDVFDSFGEFSPPLIGKVMLNVKNYWRIMDSLLSIYTGEFMIIPESQDFLMIVENGDFVVSLHKSNPGYLPRSNIDVSELSYLYDKTLSLLLKMYSRLVWLSTFILKDVLVTAIFIMFKLLQNLSYFLPLVFIIEGYFCYRSGIGKVKKILVEKI